MEGLASSFVLQTPVPNGKSLGVFAVDITTKREIFPEVVALEERGLGTKASLRRCKQSLF